MNNHLRKSGKKNSIGVDMVGTRETIIRMFLVEVIMRDLLLFYEALEE